MNRFDYLEQATASIANNRRASLVRRELVTHLDFKRDDLLATGLDADEAETRALRSLGDPALVAAAYERGPRAFHGFWHRYALYGFPLLALSLASVLVPPLAFVWAMLIVVLALGMLPGTGLGQRLRALQAVIQDARTIVWAGAAAGAAMALGTFGAPSGLWSSFLTLVVLLAPVLVGLYDAWNRREAGRDLAPYQTAGLVAMSALAAGVVVFSLGQWNLPGGEWPYIIRPVITYGVLWAPLLTLGVSWVYPIWDRLRSGVVVPEAESEGRQA